MSTKAETGKPAIVNTLLLLVAVALLLGGTLFGSGWLLAAVGEAVGTAPAHDQGSGGLQTGAGAVDLDGADTLDGGPNSDTLSYRMSLTRETVFL